MLVGWDPGVVLRLYLSGPMVLSYSLNFLITFKNQVIIQRSLDFWLLFTSYKIFNVSLDPLFLTVSCRQRCPL